MFMIIWFNYCVVHHVRSDTSISDIYPTPTTTSTRGQSTPQPAHGVRGRILGDKSPLSCLGGAGSTLTFRFALLWIVVILVFFCSTGSLFLLIERQFIYHMDNICHICLWAILVSKRKLKNNNLKPLQHGHFSNKIEYHSRNIFKI